MTLCVIHVSFFSDGRSLRVMPRLDYDPRRHPPLPFLLVSARIQHCLLLNISHHDARKLYLRRSQRTSVCFPTVLLVSVTGASGSMYQNCVSPSEFLPESVASLSTSNEQTCGNSFWLLRYPCNYACHYNLEESSTWPHVTATLG